MINKDELNAALELYEMFSQLPAMEQLLLMGYIQGRVNKFSKTIDQIENISENQRGVRE